MRSIPVLLFAAFVYSFSGSAQSPKIPAGYSNMYFGDDGALRIKINDTLYAKAREPQADYKLSGMLGNPVGTDAGIAFDFAMKSLNGKLYYGFINYDDAKYPLPVYFKRHEWIREGKAEIEIDELDGKYDMVGWEKAGKGVLGYRVVDGAGNFLFDGRIFFKGTGPFEVDHSLILGPFVNKVTSSGATVSFRTLQSISCSVACNGKTYPDRAASTYHEYDITGLEAGQSYDYTVKFGSNTLTFSFNTAPDPGTGTPFTFAYASDSRAGQGGGERDLYGANYYIVKRIMAFCIQQDAAFMQFSGDLINGYLDAREEQELQYFNWYRAIEPFAPYMPVYVSMGNHEAFTHVFPAKGFSHGIAVDRFPFETSSAEQVFSQFAVNPVNGPASEDGAVYDPDPETTDFPSYDENVFSYTYDNVAVIVLNSDYWYAPSLASFPESGGGLHGYIMDNQLDWLKTELRKFEADKNIDHVFVTQHTPAFPNGGHVSDDMWYRGNNDFRPYVAGKPLEKGIIERRDQYLDLLVNKSSKVRAILTGDEHNYAKTEVGPNTDIYPEGYPEEKIGLSRTIWQINNGSAGAPYYAQEETPWTPFVTNFSTQNVVVLFDVDGKNLKMRVINPDTFDEVDELELVGE